jgi:CSLREA domain-containing protein
MMKQYPFYPLALKLAVLLFIGTLTISLAANMMAIPSVSFTVNSTLDGTDANVGDGICETAPDNGICTLRAAIQETNALSSDDMIIVPSGTYMLTRGGALEDEGKFGDLDISDDLTFTGGGAEETIIDDNAVDRVLHIVNANATVEISGVTIQNGNLPYADQGAGIHNVGTLTLSDSIVKDNSTTDKGGGIYNGGTLNLSDSTISTNSAYSGGGFYNIGQLMLSDTTISDNDAEYGAGLYNYNYNFTAIFPTSTPYPKLTTTPN